jgi:hypothetical protein
MAVKMSLLIFWAVMLYIPEYGGSMFLQNIGIYVQVNAVLQP